MKVRVKKNRREVRERVEEILEEEEEAASLLSLEFMVWFLLFVCFFYQLLSSTL